MNINAILAVLGLQFLTGFFQFSVTIHVKPDGSGTLDQVFSMSNESLAQAKQIREAGGGAAQKLPTEIDEARLKAAAAKLGEGVTFVSAKKLALPGREGFVATYAFADITKLKVTLDPDMGEQAGGGMPPSQKQEPVTFEFTNGKTAELIINTPVKKNEPGANAAQKDQIVQMAEQMLPMLAEILKDVRVSFIVDVQGTIVKTNAMNRQGSRVTLMDVEFGTQSSHRNSG